MLKQGVVSIKIEYAIYVLSILRLLSCVRCLNKSFKSSRLFSISRHNFFSPVVLTMGLPSARRALQSCNSTWGSDPSKLSKREGSSWYISIPLPTSPWLNPMSRCLRPTQRVRFDNSKSVNPSSFKWLSAGRCIKFKIGSSTIVKCFHEVKLIERLSFFNLVISSYSELWQNPQYRNHPPRSSKSMLIRTETNSRASAEIQVLNGGWWGGKGKGAEDEKGWWELRPRISLGLHSAL